MKMRSFGPLAAAIALAFPAVGHALTSYSQNFEALSATSAVSLGGTAGAGTPTPGNDTWIGFANVFLGASYLYGYGAFPAPNGSGAFSAIVSGQGGPEQGQQQLSIYSDYDNQGAHVNGQTVEALVFQERSLVAGDAGDYVFQFDAKRGNLEGASTAAAFVKVLNPLAGYSQTASQSLNMTAAPTSWGTYMIPFTVTAGMAGQVLQFGYSNRATLNQGSAVFYDNVSFAVAAPPIPEPSTYALMAGGLALLGFMRRRRAA